MANVLNTNPIFIDTEGIISVRPICIKKVVMHVNAASDTAKFTYWDENGTPDHHLQLKTSTWATATLTSTGNLPAGAPAANDIVYIYYTSTGNNIFRFQCKTAGDNNDAVFDALAAYHGTVTNEASKLYSWKIWTPKKAIYLDAQAVTVNDEERDFGDTGIWFPNLALHTLSASVTIEVYLR